MNYFHYILNLLQGPVTASPPTAIRTTLDLLILISFNDDDRNTYPVHLAVPVRCPPAPRRRSSLPLPRCDASIAIASPAVVSWSLFVRGRAGESGSRRTGNLERVHHLLFKSQRANPYLLLPLSQICAANFGTGQLVAVPSWACRFEAGSPRAGRWSITVEQPRHPPPRHPVALPLRRRSAATGTHHEWGESVMIWGMCAITFLIHSVLNPSFPAFIADFCCYCPSRTTEGGIGNQVGFFTF